MIYRYIFRGIGVLFVIGMLTALAVAIYSQMNQERTRGPRRTRSTVETSRVWEAA